MKRISVEVEKTVKVNEKRWEAIDGTVFDTFESASEYERGFRRGLKERLGIKDIGCVMAPLMMDDRLEDVEAQYIWLPKSTDDIEEFFSMFIGDDDVYTYGKVEFDTLRPVIITYSRCFGYYFYHYDDVLEFAKKQVKNLEEIGAMV